MKEIKKQTFYQLDARYFKDYSGNGIGDLRGLVGKSDYFSFLGVKNVILQNLLALDKNQIVQDYKRVATELGTANDLKTLISKLNAKDIALYIEMPIGSIKESHKWFKSIKDTKVTQFDNMVKLKPSAVEPSTKTGEFKYSESNKAYYEVDTKTQEISLNWSENTVIEKFAEIVRHWNDLGVKGFVFTGFEYIMDPSKKHSMNEKTLKELRKFYNTVKQINDNITVIGKSEIIFDKTFSVGPNKVFDYFMSEAITLLGTHKSGKKDLIGNFKPSTLAKMISKYADKPEHIVTFGSSNIGRVNARWGDSGQYSHETAKLISMLLLLNKGSSSIYFGDEIGALNIGLTRLDDFQDDTLFVRKEALLKDGVKNDEIMDAQILQNPINSRSLMAWDETKNGGFSNNEKTITPVSTTYKEINVKNQFDDKSSPLLFNKELIKIVTNSTYRKIIVDGNFSISSIVPGVIKLTFKNNKREIRIYANLTDKNRPIKKAKFGKVVLSTKYHKVYNKLPKSLDAYEGIIISKQADEFFKETRMLKLHEKKEVEKQAKIAEKTRLIELNQKEKEKIAKAKEEMKKENARLVKEQEESNNKAKQLEIAEAKKVEQKKIAEKIIAKKEAEAANIEAEAKKAKDEADKQAEKEAREAEKIKIFENKQAEKEESKILKEKAKAAKLEEKEKLRAEKEAVKQMRQEAKKFSIMDEEIHESERTTLTEDDIAATTQIDADKIDDFEAFLNADNKPKKK